MLAASKGMERAAARGRREVERGKRGMQRDGERAAFEMDARG